MNKKYLKIMLGTNNPHKREKLKWIVEDFFAEIKEMRKNIEIEEVGKTFEENARLKALGIAKAENSYAIATDGGVLIPALGSNWNELLTKRFAGLENAGDFDRMDMLLDLMRGKTGKDRMIVWKEAIAIAAPGGIIFSCEVEGDRGILQESYDPMQYKKGIWLCTLTSYPQFGGRNFFELDEEEKKYGEISWWKLKEKVGEFLFEYFKKD